MKHYDGIKWTPEQLKKIAYNVYNNMIKRSNVISIAVEPETKEVKIEQMVEPLIIISTGFVEIKFRIFIQPEPDMLKRIKRVATNYKRSKHVK